MTPVHLISVSIPRAGHNLLVRLLGALFQGELFYCEWYGAPNCCRRVPCARRGTARLSLQKSHDFDLDVPQDIADATYLIQHRVPVAATLSARELYAEQYGDAVAADRGEYAVWLGRYAEYYVAFSRRWLRHPPPKSVLIDYADLADEPAQTLRRVLARANTAATGGAIDAAVAATMPQGGLFGEHPYARRSLDDSRYLDRELLAVYESIIVDRLPHLGSSRVFEPVDYRDTLVGRVFEARRAWRAGDLETALATVDGALDRGPNIGLLFHERATILQALGRLREAQAVLATAATFAPVHPVILEELITVSFMLGDSEAAAGTVKTLAALVDTGQLDRPERDIATAAMEGTSLAPDQPPVEPDGGPRPALGPSSAADSAIRSEDTLGRDPPSADGTTGNPQDDPKVPGDELQEKERMIVALAMIAEERAAELQHKEAMIDALAATAEERLELIRRLHAESASLREALADSADQRQEEVRERLVAPLRQEALDRSIIRLRQQERVIAELAATAEERLRRIEQFAVEYTALSEEFKRLTRQQPPSADPRRSGDEDPPQARSDAALIPDEEAGRSPSSP